MIARKQRRIPFGGISFQDRCGEIFFWCFDVYLIVDSDAIEGTVSKVFQKISGVRVDLDGFLFKSRDLRNKVQTSFTLFFLKLQRYSSDWSLGNTLHQVGGETSNLVTHTLGWKDGNFIDNTLVGVEVQRQASVVLLDNCTSTSFNSLSSNSLCIFSTYK